MNEARNINSGKVHLMEDGKTFCGIINPKSKKNMEVTECKEIRHDTVCHKCYVGYNNAIDSTLK